MCETVTLSHLVRPLTLLKNNSNHTGILASTHFPKFLEPELAGLNLDVINGGVDSNYFSEQIYRGKVVYSEEILNNYIDEDKRLIEKHRPDIIVSDFRLSTSISSKHFDIPVISLANLSWSPYAVRKLFMPEHPAEKIFGPQVTNLIMRAFFPLLSKPYLSHMNRVRRQFNLPEYDNIFEMYSYGDFVAYLDAQNYVELKQQLPNHHRIIGPALYSASVDNSKIDDEYLNSNNLVLVTLGSSGYSKNLDVIMQAISELPVKAIVGTFRDVHELAQYKNIFTTKYLDINYLLKKASLFIGNGGCPTNYLALSNGVPVIGIPYNLDQYLNAHYLEKKGVGKMLRSGRLKKHSVKEAIMGLLDDKYKKNAESLSANIKSLNIHEEFESLLASL